MDSRHLVKAAITHHETPRSPVRIDICPDAWAEVQRRVPGAESDAFLGNDVVTIRPPWWAWKDLGLEWAAETAPRSLPTVAGSGSYEVFIEEVARTVGAGKYVLCEIYGSHWEKAYFARGIENLLSDMAGDRAWARDFLSSIVDRNLAMLDNILAVPGVDGVLLGSDWGCQRNMIMSPRLWRELIAPGEKREYDLIHGHGKDVWVHSCGHITPIIPDLIELGVDVLNPLQPEVMDLDDIKSRFGDRLTMWGGISTQRTLPFGTPDEVRAEARDVRRRLGAGGGFIYSPSQHIQTDVPYENLCALVEVGQEAV